MELESEEGAKIPIKSGSTTEIGRDLGLGFRCSYSNRTVSRRHLSLQRAASPEPRVSFEVIGKNPILVRPDSGGGGGGGERIYRNSERGELRVGDKFSLLLRNPRFFVLKTREEEEDKRRILDAVERREKRTLERRREKEDKEKREERDEEEFDLDTSQIDPVKEFGFLVKGHEFDRYPKINFKNWNWFLDEPGKNGDDDETDDDQGTRSKRKKGEKKVHGGDEDEEWTGESEEEKEVFVKGGSGKRPEYSTRSRDPKKPRKDVQNTRKDEVDEEDGTLGGFIVDEDEVEEEPEDEESEEEMEEEEDDEDDYD